MRLAPLLYSQGFGTRRECVALVAAGRVERVRSGLTRLVIHRRGRICWRDKTWPAAASDQLPDSA